MRKIVKLTTYAAIIAVLYGVIHFGKLALFQDLGPSSAFSAAKQGRCWPNHKIYPVGANFSYFASSHANEVSFTYE